MATLGLGDLFALRVYCRRASQVGVNVRHYRISAAIGAGARDNIIAAEYATALGLLYRSLLTAEASFLGVGVQKMRVVPADQVYSITNAGVGDRATDALPSQTAGLISWRTGVPTRAGRGRTYVPFPAEGDNTTEGAPSAGYLLSLDSLASAMLTTRTILDGVSSSTCLPVIWRRTGDVRTDVIQQIVRPYWATQRRRNTGNRGDVSPIG